MLVAASSDLHTAWRGASAKNLSLGYGRYNDCRILAGYGGSISGTRFDIQAGWNIARPSVRTGTRLVAASTPSARTADPATKT